jgi:NADH:ubiquinone oxidoreductase subunit 5 (subunit L)/multisubunit Na+/H+ antiporter MnhA subunit
MGQGGQAVDLNLLHWDGPLALVFHVDALSVLFALMGTGLGAFVLLYSIGYMAHDKAATRFYASMLVFIGGFVGLVYSANLFSSISAGNWSGCAPSVWWASGTPTARPSPARAKCC